MHLSQATGPQHGCDMSREHWSRPYASLWGWPQTHEGAGHLGWGVGSQAFHLCPGTCEPALTHPSQQLGSHPPALHLLRPHLAPGLTPKRPALCPGAAPLPGSSGGASPAHSAAPAPPGLQARQLVHRTAP